MAKKKDTAVVDAGVGANPLAPSQDEEEKADNEPVVIPPQARKLDETIPGGRYIVNGVLVDCNNKPIKDSNEEIKEA